MMNKVYTITFHWATNYGAVLQAYALQTFLVEMGYDVEIINYVPEKYKKTLLRCFRTRKLQKVKKQIKEYLKEKKIEKFRNKYLHRTKCFSSNGQLLNEEWEVATYICGSDQIWNPYFTMQGEGKPTSAYYLEFVPDNSNKIAYAASFGSIEIKEEMKRYVKELLKTFQEISVRENTAKQIVRDLNLEATIVCDPVFLLDSKKYEVLIDGSWDLEGQLFSYILHENQEQAERVSKYVADILGLEHFSEVNLSIEQWLGRIKKAGFLITNSFHATAFALIFHIPFLTVLISGSGMNDRIKTLLEKMGLQDRIIECFDEKQINQVVECQIDWNNVDAQVSKIREFSKNFLLKSCG